MLAGMSKQSMAALRERRTELGLVQMNLWIRDEDRAEFEAAVAPFRDRATEIDSAHKSGRKPLETVRESIHRGLEANPAQRPPQAPQKPARRQSPPKPRITLPCRLTFPTPPPASLRNAMKDDGWRYERDRGIWIADQLQVASAWLPELLEDWGAHLLGPPED
jgi:hypothetical protein